MTNALGEVLETTGERQAYLLGSSYGGFLSLTFALTYPQKVRGLVLVGTSASHQFRQDSLNVAQQKGNPDMLAMLERLWNGGLTNDTDFYKAWREILPLYFCNLPIDEIHQLANSSTYNLNTRKEILPTLHAYDVRARLGEIQVPSLVLVGEHDWITGLRQAEELVNNLAESQLVVFYESGHYPFIEENSKFTSVVEGWLNAVSEREKGKHDASSKP
jgi:proline iminopeptidase